MYEINDKTYVLRYSIERLETIEKEAGISAFSFVANTANGNAPSLFSLIYFFSRGLYEAESGTYCPVGAAKRFAEEHMKKNGYARTVAEVIEQLKNDCDFLFQ